MQKIKTNKCMLICKQRFVLKNSLDNDVTKSINEFILIRFQSFT